MVHVETGIQLVMMLVFPSRQATGGSKSLDNSAWATCLPWLPLIASSDDYLVTLVQNKATCNLWGWQNQSDCQVGQAGSYIHTHIYI